MEFFTVTCLTTFWTDVGLGELDPDVPVQLVGLHVTLRPEGFRTQVARKRFRS
jgi:hypothetical protein